MIDLTPGSQKVLQWAAEDALDHHASMVILYTYRLKAQRDGEQRAALKKRLEQEAYERFEKLRSTISLLDKIPYTFTAEVGFETDRLEANLQSRNFRLMVMSRDVAKAGELQKEWDDFMLRMTVPIVLIP